MCATKGTGKGGARAGAGRPPLPADVVAARARVQQIERQLDTAYRATVNHGRTISEAEYSRLQGLVEELHTIQNGYPNLRLPGGRGDWPHDIGSAIQTAGLTLSLIEHHVR